MLTDTPGQTEGQRKGFPQTGVSLGAGAFRLLASGGPQAGCSPDPCLLQAGYASLSCRRAGPVCTPEKSIGTETAFIAF